MTRVTSQVLQNKVENALQLAYQRLTRAQEVVSTGRRINMLSDDPAGAAQIMGLRRIEGSIERYGRSLDAGLTFLAHADTAFTEVEKGLIRAKEIGLQMANGVYSSTDRSAAAKEIHQIFDHLLTVANAKLDDRYLFGGFKSQTVPFRENGASVDYLGDNGQIEVESGPDGLMTINFAGNRVLQGVAVTGGQGVFDVLKDLERLLDGHLPLSRLGMSINFDSSVLAGTGFSAPDAVGTESPAASFLAEAQFSTTVTVFDDKGIGHDLVFVFAKTSTTSYSYRVLVDAADTGGSPGNFRQVATEGTLQFDSAGILDLGSSSLTDITVTGLSSGARDIDIDAAGISFAGSVETARPSELLSLQQSNGNGMAAQLARIDAAFNQVLVFRAEASERLQSGELARDALDTWGLQLTGERSRIEDADILAAYSEFARLQTAFNAALQAAAQVLKPSLLDFLR